MNRLLHRIFLISLLLSLATPSIAAPRVIATIKPVHSLVAAVMQDVATPELLIRGYHSPHTFSLKPSQMRELESADIIFWVGEALETSLQKTLQAAAADHQVIELIDTEGLRQLKARAQSRWEQSSPEIEAHQHSHHSSIDPHIWLSPFNAAVLVERIRQVLSAFDPEHAQQYRDNADLTQQRIQQLDQKIQQQLAPFHHQPFVVFHDAYQHFEHHYGLHAIAAVSADPDRLPGARHISDIQNQIKQQHVSCVFNESQFKSRLINTISEGNQVTVAQLDPLGATLKAGKDEWFDLMQNLSSAIAGCLSANAD
jgi:zinc transport system substrate-binding protein